MINYNEILKQDASKYKIIDVRNAESYQYGHIINAINIPSEQIKEKAKDFDASKIYYLYCRNGKLSGQCVQMLREMGLEAYCIEGGYIEWLRTRVDSDETLDIALKAEDSIRHKFHRELFSQFCKALNEYELLKEGDKVAVCISGGKDSMLMAKLFQELQRHTKFPFEVVFLCMDPGYNKKNREKIEKNAKILNIPLQIFETDIFENVFHIDKSPCYVCARMRRGHLYNKAKSLGCNKIALGHHYDDVIETILMGVLYGAQVQTMMPKLHSNNFEGMELIRPMYLIRERDVKRWRDYNNLDFIQCACKFTEQNYGTDKNPIDNTASKRKKVKELIAKLSREEHQIEGNIFRSVETVNLATIISYKDEDGKVHSFLDDYDNKKPINTEE